MVKYLALVVAVMGSLAVADLAEARGRRGCSTCNTCPGGVCYTTVAPAKTAYTSDAPPVPVAGGDSAGQPVAAATAPQSTPRYYNASSSSRRGIFGWRR